MNVIGSYDAKTHLPQLLARVERGESFLITRHGFPIARLTPAEIGETCEDLDATVSEILEFRKRHTLGELKIADLVSEGRK